MESVTMKPEDALNRVFHELDVRVDPRVDERILRDTLHRLKESTETPPADSRPMRWRTVMKYPLAKLAIAAAVIVTALLGIHFFSRTSGTSWAAVLDKVNGFDTCVYRVREVETTGPRPDGFEFATEAEHKHYRSETYGCFRETYKKGKATEWQYLLLQEKQHVAIYSEMSLCLRSPIDEKILHTFYTEDPASSWRRSSAGLTWRSAAMSSRVNRCEASNCATRMCWRRRGKKYLRWMISLCGSGSMSRRNCRCGWR